MNIKPGSFFKGNSRFNITRIQQAKYGLTISISILCIILYVVFSVNKRNNELAQEVTHSATVIASLERINARINELESAQRGYTITSYNGFRESFAEGERELKTEVAALKDLVADYPAQQENVSELAVIIEAQRGWLNRNMENRSLGRLLMGKMMMTRVLLKINMIRGNEEAHMSKKISKLKEWSNSSAIVIIICVVSAAIMIIIAYLILVNEYGFKLRAEQQLLTSQAQLQEKLEMLDVSNKELEQFAYIASHDLQEPLRKIMTFNERIHQKFSEVSSPELKDYLDRISAAASRMRVLIDDLLTYSKASRNDIRKVPVSLEQVFSIIKDNCEVIIQNRNVRFVQHGRLPELLGDKTQMVQLFQNLITNAIKFTKEDVTPEINVFCSTVGRDELQKEIPVAMYDQYLRVEIKDNGIGFHEKDLKRIFTIFQRLHGRSEYEGTGIGLSICKKIVENHHGYITAGSEPDKGSSFVVYLPYTPIS
jgi:signal transduction histidine kinase